ncbi:MAG: DUF4037 domain-containing protein [Acidobacteria bacterium]|nr:DUF4037 domain-containing protein [Acidobacteriota bacterium]
MDKNYASIKPTSPISHQYRRLAQKIADLCPKNFATEIALIGSTACGVADEDSDIELICWINNIATALERKEWLETIGAREILIDKEPLSDGSVWTTCLFENTWVEIGWQNELAQEKLLCALLEGTILDSSQLIGAGLLTQAIILRSNGLINNWQNRLKYYPENLSTALISSLIKPWQSSHLIKVRFALVKRQQRFALTQKLTQDINNLLRILFAVNKKWESSTKWLDLVLEQMTIKPLKLVERIDRIFSCLSLNEKVCLTLELIIETLNLLPQSPDIKQAINTLEKNLD